MAAWQDVFWWSNDGLRLHAREYPGAADKLPVLCLPGLTRNARDYDVLARRLAGPRRVLAVDLRGRGESAYARDPMSYVPLTYAQDIAALLADRKIERFVAVGTSLGGIVTMLLAGMLPGRIAGALLNDVGPEIEPAGLARIRGYVGRSSAWPTWMHAARAVQEGNAEVYPDWTIKDWLAMAKRLYRLNNAGRIVLDYDLKIAEPFRVPGNEAGPDMWRALAALRKAPVLVVRGGRSDILTAPVAERMIAALPDAELLTLPDIGHAPTLAEPEVDAAIDRLLARAEREPQAA
ncbi:alpha/beta fold hydrolase [Sphingomonas radiodurans]|uniref:alpha/beta fold hydrolase n=1 Tax=Sphingomonas radiodurans TaxID=2890321 RepID=UPI001E5B3BEC|nr:alpha/beta hydrolase [Sphingomonas radiodurans]WBH17066.1 alpha/beta hydrolase [Sphingomonas radiodurans]